MEDSEITDQTHVGYCGLSVRAENVLAWFSDYTPSINTFGKLRQQSFTDLTRRRNCGVSTATEIMNRVTQILKSQAEGTKKNQKMTPEETALFDAIILKLCDNPTTAAKIAWKNVIERRAVLTELK